jgi:glycosyltransferase involved in cell wall biosynthesis
MTIAINCYWPFPSAAHEWVYDYLLAQAEQSPEHQFIFVLPKGSRQGEAPNITNVWSSPAGRNPVFLNWWLNRRLLSIVKKYQAELLVHTGGLCSRAPGIEQWLVVAELAFLALPQSYPRKRLRVMKKSTPVSLQRADKIACASPLVCRQFMETYGVEPEKLMEFRLLPAPGFQPAGWNEKELIKEKYSSGKEYFLFSGEIDQQNNLVNLLKAFSFFKKRQRSNMRLLICLPAGEQIDAFTRDLASYKFRAEVSLFTGLDNEELEKVMAGAYAFIFPVDYEGSGLACMKAMQCGVPVIATAQVGLDESLADAIITVNPGSFEDIAGKMMLVFKDERLRGELIGKAGAGLLRIRESQTRSIWGGAGGANH